MVERVRLAAGARCSWQSSSEAGWLTQASVRVVEDWPSRLRSAASPAPLVASQGVREIETPTFISSRRTSLFFRATILASRHSSSPALARPSHLLPHLLAPPPHAQLLTGLPCFLHSCSICSVLRHLRLADLCALKSAPAMLRRRDTGAIAMRACERQRLSFERSSLRTRARTRARSGERAAFETRGSRGRGLSELFSQVARSALARSPQLRPVPRPRSKLSARCRHPWGRSLPRSVLGLSAS